MAINKVEFGGNTLIDITDTTAIESDVASGKTFYLKDGTKATGTASGGSSSWTKLGETDITTSTTSTSNTNIGSIECGSAAATKDKIIYVRIRDKAGKRAGYFLGSDCFFINYQKANNSSSALSYAGRYIFRVNANNSQYAAYVGNNATGYGVFAYSISGAGKVNIYQRYNANYSLTIDGTYHIEVYSLDYPDGHSIFDI